MEVSCKWRAQLVFWTGEHNFAAVLSVIQTWKLLPCWVSSFLRIVVQLTNKLCLKWPNFLKCCDAPMLLHYINMLCCLRPFLLVYPWSETGKISNCLLGYCAINSLSREDYCSAHCILKLIWLFRHFCGICMDASLTYAKGTEGLYFPGNTNLDMGGLLDVFCSSPNLLHFYEC